MNDQISTLHRYLKKEGHLFEAELLRKIIKKADTPPSKNSLVKEMLRLNKVPSSAISRANLGSEVEYRYGEDGVAKLTIIDSLKNENVLCMSWSKEPIDYLSKYSLSEALKSYSGSSEKEKLDRFLKENRSMGAFGDYNKFLGKIFGSTDAVISNEMVASMSKYLYLIPPHFKVNVVEEMTVDGVAVGDLIDFASDIASVGLSLGAAFVSGGTLLIPSIAANLRAAASITNIIDIYNNLFNKRFFEALIGILALGLNIKNTKPLISFYKKYIEKSGGIIFEVPQYFLDILAALFSSVTLIGDDLSEVIDDFIKEKLETLLPGEMSEHEIHNKIKEQISKGSTDPLIIFANNYYEKDGAAALREAADSVASKIEPFIKA